MARQDWASYIILFGLISVAILQDLCPYKECQCVEDVIECEDLNLNALPPLLISAVSWQPTLTLNSNSISKITAGGLPSGLGAIDFEGNPITFVDEYAFQGSESTLSDLKFSEMNMDECPFAFYFLDNLKHLSIKYSHIRQWDMDIFGHLGDSLQTLTLVDVGFTEWPTWILNLPHLYDLEFSSAQVVVPDYVFDQFNYILSSVTMKNVSLMSTMNIFTKLVSLRDLILDNNIISHVSGLPQFGNLTTLSLRNNSISNKTHLVDALNTVANSLGTLYLDSNKLTSFPDLSLMTKLETLYLSKNDIYDTNSGSIPASLRYLELQHNRIASLASLLKGGVQLQSVGLSDNSITAVRSVDIPTSVSQIDFTSNLIVELTDSSFPHNSSMGNLRFDFNPIASISSSAFSNLQHLTYLSMTNTRLSRIPISVASLQSLVTLDLTGNVHMVCTCLDTSFRKWSKLASVTISGDCGLTSIGYFLRTLSADCPAN